MSRARAAAVCALILAGAGGIAALIFASEPTATRGGASVKTAMLVDVAAVERGDFRPVITALGEVQPARDVTLRSQVSGEVVALDPELVPGGRVDRGDVLLRLESADYRNVVKQRRSALKKAEAALAIEMGRQDIARKDYALLGKELAPGKQKLVLREPQLESARGEVESARAALEQARLDLQRTTIRAPMTAQVLTREIDVGSQVSPSDPLARLVGIETYWVEIALPLSKLRWLRFPDKDDPSGSPVTVRNRSAWAPGVSRSGELYKLVGALDDKTRMARVLVAIDDPLARAEGAAGPPLIVGAFVEAQIRGARLDDVVKIDRSFVRDGDTVWVYDDGELRIREVEVAVLDAEHAFIASGLEGTERVVTSDLATVTEGARLRIREGEPPGG